MTATEIISILAAFAALLTSIGAFLANRARVKTDEQDAAANLVKASTELIDPLRKRIEELVQGAVGMKALIDSLEERVTVLVEENVRLKLEGEKLRAEADAMCKDIKALQEQVTRLGAVPVVPAKRGKGR